MRLILSAVLSIGLLHGTADAQSPIQLADIEHKVITSGGSPTYCTIEFTLMYRDFAYKAGATSAAVGSLNWLALRGQLALYFKIVGSDLPKLPQGDATVVPHQISQAYVSANGDAFLPDARIQCEEAKGFCAAYQMPKSTDLLRVFQTSGTLSVAFNRHVTGLDVVLPIDARFKDGETAIRFSSCLRTMLERAKSQLETGSTK